MNKLLYSLVLTSSFSFAGVTYITPHIDGVSFCPSAINDKSVRNNEEAALYCYKKGEDSADTINSSLNKIDGGKVRKGNFELGYTLTLPLFRYYQQDSNGKWFVNKSFLNHDIDVIRHINRPVNIYLSLNHFTDSNEKLSRELATDSRNIMWDAHGPMPISDYFGYPVIPWTISDFNAPITRYRETVFRDALFHIKELMKDVPGRIVGVSILGEVHQMNRDIMAGPSYSVDMNDTSDYSPSSVEGFRKWLPKQFASVTAMNKDLGSSYKSFTDVYPPSKNIRKDMLNSFLQHNDEFSSGKMDIYGWMTDTRQCKAKINVYLDGKKIGRATYGLNRTDVAQAINIKNPNVGFRYSLDFRNLNYGSHRVWLTEVCNGKETLLDNRAFSYVDRKQSPTPIINVPAPSFRAKSAAVTVSVDGPKSDQDVYFNPLSELWQQYRRDEVKEYLQHFAQIADGYLPKSLVFSHQITTELNGSWNEGITAEGDSKKENAFYNQGTTLYGGASFGDAFFANAKRDGWKAYSISEMNPMSDIGVKGYVKMLDRHNRAGARFVSPYFISVISDILPSRGLNMFEMKPGNTAAHSDQFYEALRVVMH